MWRNEWLLLSFSRTNFIVWITKVTKVVCQFLISLCYNFLNSFVIEFIQKFKILEKRLAELRGLATSTWYLAINVLFDTRIY